MIKGKHFTLKKHAAKSCRITSGWDQQRVENALTIDYSAFAGGCEKAPADQPKDPPEQGGASTKQGSAKQEQKNPAENPVPVVGNTNPTKGTELMATRLP